MGDINVIILCVPQPSRLMGTDKVGGQKYFFYTDTPWMARGACSVIPYISIPTVFADVNYFENARHILLTFNRLSDRSIMVEIILTALFIVIKLDSIPDTHSPHIDSL